MVRTLSLVVVAAIAAFAAAALPAADAATLTLSSETYVLDTDRFTLQNDPTGLHINGANDVVTFEFGGEQYVAVSTFGTTRSFAFESSELRQGGDGVYSRGTTSALVSGEQTVSIMRLSSDNSVNLSPVTSVRPDTNVATSISNLGGEFVAHGPRIWDVFTMGDRTFMLVTGATTGSVWADVIHLLEVVESGASVKLSMVTTVRSGDAPAATTLSSGTNTQGGQIRLKPISGDVFEVNGDTFVALGNRFLQSYQQLIPTEVPAGTVVLHISPSGRISLASEAVHGQTDSAGNTYGPSASAAEQAVVESFTVGETTYLLACNEPDDESSACHVMSVGTDGLLTIVDTWASDRILVQRDGSLAFEQNGRTYVALIGIQESFPPSTGTDRILSIPGVHILDVSDPANIELASTAGSPDTPGADPVLDELGAEFSELGGAQSLALTKVGSSTYLLVGNGITNQSVNSNGLQVIDVTDPSVPLAAASLDDSDDTLLANVGGVAAFENSLGKFAISASHGAITPGSGNLVGSEAGLQVTKIEDNSAPALYRAELQAGGTRLALSFDEPPVARDGTLALQAARPNDGRTFDSVRLEAPSAGAGTARAFALSLTPEQARAVAQFEGGVNLSATAGLWRDALHNLTPNLSVPAVPGVVSAEAVSPYTVLVTFSAPMADAGAPAAWSIGDASAQSVEAAETVFETVRFLNQERTVGRPQLSSTENPLAAYLTFARPVSVGQSLSYEVRDTGRATDSEGRVMQAQSVAVSPRSAYSDADTPALLASVSLDGQISPSPARIVTSFDPEYQFQLLPNIPYHALGGATDVAVFTVKDGETLARTLYSGDWNNVRYDPATMRAHLSGNADAPDRDPVTVDMRGTVGTFAVVAAAQDADAGSDSGLQIIDITNPYRPLPVSHVRDSLSPAYACTSPPQPTTQPLPPECTKLDGDMPALPALDEPSAVEIAQIGGRTYAVVASNGDNGIQIVDVTDPRDPRAAASADSSSWPGVDPLDGAYDLAVFSIGERTYVAVTAEYGDGGSGNYLGTVPIYDISDPSVIRPVSIVEAGARDADGRTYDYLESPRDIDIFKTGGSTYAVVSSYALDAVQIIDVSDPASPKMASSITSYMLDRDGGAFGDMFDVGPVRAFSIEGAPYALVSSADLVQIVGLADPSAPRIAGSIDGLTSGPFDDLSIVKGLDVLQTEGRTVAAITVAAPSGLFLADITDPSSPQRLAYAKQDDRDPAGNSVDFDGAAGVVLRVLDGRLYAAVASAEAGPAGSSLAGQNAQHSKEGGLAMIDLSGPAGLGEPRPVRVGALAPLTGLLSPLGLHWEAAMKVAERDVNADLEGKGADWRLALDIRDTAGSPDTALAQLRELDALGIKAVIGPPTSADLALVKSYADARGITLISYASTAPSVEGNPQFNTEVWGTSTAPSGLGSLGSADGTFRLIPPDSLAAPFLAEQLYNSGKDHVTIVFRDDPWERALAEDVRDRFARLSRTASLVPHESPVTDTAALGASLAEAHRTGNSAVLLFAFSGSAVAVMSAAEAASSAPGATAEARALGTSQWFGMSVLDNMLSHPLQSRFDAVFSPDTSDLLRQSEVYATLVRLSASETSVLDIILDPGRLDALFSRLPASAASQIGALYSQAETARDFASKVNYTLVQEVPDRDHPSFATFTSAAVSMLDDRPRSLDLPSYAAYDAVRLMARAMERADSYDLAGLSAAIPEAARGHAGLLGDNTLDRNGDLAAAAFQLTQVRDGAAVDIPNYEIPFDITRFEVSSDHASGMATDGSIVTVTFEAAQTFTVGEFGTKINGRDTALSPPLPPTPGGDLPGAVFESQLTASSFTAVHSVGSGHRDGPLSITVKLAVDGIPVTLDERSLTGPNVIVDNTAPQLESASLIGARSLALFYSEPVVTAAADYTAFEYGPSSASAADSVRGSGTESILVRLGASEDAITPGVRVSLDVYGVQDRVGNALLNEGTVSLIPSETSERSVVLRDTAKDGEANLALPPDYLIDTLVAGQPVALDVSLLPSPASVDARLASAGGGTAEFAAALDVRFSSATVSLPAGLQVGGLPSDGTLDMSVTSSSVPSDEYVLLSGIDPFRHVTLIEVGDPSERLELSAPARIEFASALQDHVFVTSGGSTLAVQECPEELTGSATPAEAAGFLASLEESDMADAGACYVRQDSVVWTTHFSAWGTGPQAPSGGSDCDDCTAPTLGYDSYGARLVDGGFAYNGLVSDVEYFFTPYPLIESEVGADNTISLKMYENSGPENVSHVSVAFGLRSGEVISESRAVINYDIAFDGAGTLSVIDPENAIDGDLSASHETVSCSEGSNLQCLLVTIDHSFRAPLEFDIVGTDVWDRERNSWQNYFNHGIRVTGESLNAARGVAVNGGALVLYPLTEGTSNVEVMADERRELYRLSPDGEYRPLRNVSSLFHDIDESMYLSEGVPMQGYDRSDPRFRDYLYAQVAAAQKVLDAMMPAPEPGEPASEPAAPDYEAAQERLRAAVAAEQEKARLLFEELFGYQRINEQDYYIGLQ